MPNSTSFASGCCISPDPFHQKCVRPDPVTRGQFAKIVVETLEFIGVSCAYSTPPPFTDVGTNDTFYRYIQCLYEKGIVHGFSNNTFRTNEPLTRAQAAKIIVNAFANHTPEMDQEAADQQNEVCNNSSPVLGDTLSVVTPATDTDCYRLTVDLTRDNATNLFEFITMSAGRNANLQVDVLDATGNTLLSTSELGVNGGPAFQWEPTQSGTYYVKLTNTTPYACDGTFTYASTKMVDNVVPTSVGLLRLNATTPVWTVIQIAALLFICALLTIYLYRHPLKPIFLVIIFLILFSVILLPVTTFADQKSIAVSDEVLPTAQNDPKESEHGRSVADECNNLIRDGYEPNNSSNQARQLALNSTQSQHNISPISDIDWFRFTLSAESHVELQTLGDSGDTRMWLYNSNLSQVEYDADDGAGTFSKIDRVCEVDPLPSGTYFIKVDEYGNSDIIRDYSTQLRSSECPATGDQYEPDNAPNQATWINHNATQTHSIVPADDVDYVKFTLSDTSGVVLSTAGASADTRMWLYDSSLNEIEFNDDGGTNYFSRIDRACGTDALPSGTYYVKVDEYGNNNEIDSYSISLSVSDCGYYFYDNFSDANSGWPIDNVANYRLRYNAGYYEIQHKASEYWFAVVYPSVGSISYKAETSVRMADQSPVRYGLIFDWQS